VNWQYSLAAHADSVAQARGHVREALSRWADQDTLDRVELVVSELVTNSIRYGPGDPITLRLTATPAGEIAGEVQDNGEGVVAIRRRDFEALAGGLGLPIVDQLTSSWGVHPDTTHVWFRVAAA
jgi:anti-sigma regulatory factor (Ser/Thr protein kinase)